MELVGAKGESSNATGVDGNQGDNSASQSGAAYVYVKGVGTWSQQAYLKATNTAETDFFAFSLAASGDTVVVGANFEDSNATGVNGNQSDNTASHSSAAYVFNITPSSDCDGDGDVDLTDFDGFRTCMEGPTEPLLPDCSCFDLDADLDVDLRDFVEFAISLDK